MGVASLVLGICSVVFAMFFSVYGWLAAILGIIGIVLGALGRKAGQGGTATAGLVLSIIGTAWGLITYLACVALVASVDNALSNL